MVFAAPLIGGEVAAGAVDWLAGAVGWLAGAVGWLAGAVAGGAAGEHAASAVAAPRTAAADIPRNTRRPERALETS
jgi:hypothetical protein